MTPPKLEVLSDWMVKSCECNSGAHKDRRVDPIPAHQCEFCIEAYIDAVREDERKRIWEAITNMHSINSQHHRVIENAIFRGQVPNESEAGDGDNA